MRDVSNFIVPKRWTKVTTAQTVLIANNSVHESNMFNGCLKAGICETMVKRYRDSGDKGELMLFVKTMDQIQIIQRRANDACKVAINNMGSLS